MHLNTRMQRVIEKSLEKWASGKAPKPLLIRGARQVGKSWSVRQLGNMLFPGKYVEINFEKMPNLHQVFKEDFDVQRIVQELELLMNVSIEKGSTLLFFDEIQECPEAIIALRYFYEDMPGLHVVAAGSLLEFALSTISFPVGRIEQIAMHPFTFVEFLRATGKEKIANLLELQPVEQSEMVTQIISKSLEAYFIVGGMPACINEYLETNNFAKVQVVQENLLLSYQQDFNKYRPFVNVDCLSDVLQNVVQKIGQQIIYTKLSDRFTMPTIKKAFEALTKARLLHKVTNVSVAGLPLAASGKQFKSIFLDIGLFTKFSRLNIIEELEKKALSSMFNGALAEQFVGQEIMAKNNELNYWARTEKSSTAEVDYVIVQEGKIIPIEVKAAVSGSLRSLHLLLQSNAHIKSALVISNARLGKIDNLHFIPLGHTGQFVSVRDPENLFYKT